MQTKNVNANHDPQPAEEATPSSSSEVSPTAPGSPAPPLPPRLSAAASGRVGPHQYGLARGPGGTTTGNSSNDTTVYSAYKSVPTPRPYPPPYRMPPVPVPPQPSVYQKYGSEPILPGTMAPENGSNHPFSNKFPSPMRRDIDLSQSNWAGQETEGLAPRIPTLADLTKGQPRPRTAHAAIAPEPGPPPPRSQVWVDEKAASRNIPVQQRLRTLLNHSPVNDSEKGRTKPKALEGEPLLPCSRRAVSYPEGISNPGLEDGEGYVPSQPHQRKEGSRGQVLLDRQPRKILLHESNPNINYHPPVSATTSAESTDTTDGSCRAPSVNTVWSTGTLSEDGHSNKLRDTYLKLYPTSGRIGQPSWMPLGPNRKEDGPLPYLNANSAKPREIDPSQLSAQASQQFYYSREMANGQPPEQMELVRQKIHGHITQAHSGEGDEGVRDTMHQTSSEFSVGHHSLLQNGSSHHVSTNSVHPHAMDPSVSSNKMQSSLTGDATVPHQNGTDPNAQQLAQGRELEKESLYQKLSSLNANYYNESVQINDKNLYNSANQNKECGEKKWSVSDELSSNMAGSTAPVPVLPTSIQKVARGGVNCDSAQSEQQSSGSSDYERNAKPGTQASVTTASESGRGTMPGTPSLKSGSLSGTLDSSLESDINTYHTRLRPPEWRDAAPNDFCSRKNPTVGITQQCSADTVSDTLSVSPPLPPLSPTQSNSDSSVMSPKYSKYKLSVSAPSLNKPNHMMPEHHLKTAGGWPHGSKKLGSHHMAADPPRSWTSRQHASSKSQPSGSSHSRNKALRIPIVLNPSLSNIHEAGDGEITSTTTGLDMESLLDEVTASSLSSDQGSSHDESEVHDLRRQLEGLENMYSDVLKMLGMTSRNVPRSLADVKPKKKVHGSLSSLTGKGYSSSTSKGHTFKEKRYSHDKRKSRDGRGVGRRFQRLESHVVTLARSVAHLSSEMRTQHVMFQEIESLRREIGQLRDQQMALRMNASSNAGTRARGGGLSEWENFRSSIPSLTNPTRIKKLAKFFGAEPPLLRLFLKKLGYERYASNFEAEKIGMIELPYLTEERLQKIGIPMGPRMRILQEAQMSFRQEHFSIYIV